MNGRATTVFAAAALSCVSVEFEVEARQANDLASLVALHYPQVLVERSLQVRGVEPRREQCFAVLEASPAGTPLTVVAAYTNLTSGAIRLLRASGTAFEVAAETGAEYFTGSRCEAEAIDVNNDGRKEAVVRFLSRNSTDDWVFDWDGEDFRNVSPTTTDAFGLIGSKLLNTSFVDVDGDNILEAFTFSEPPQDGQPAPGEVYRLVGASYALDRPIIAMGSFQRASGTPQTLTQTILLPIGAVGPFTLRVVNGAGVANSSGKKVENAVESGRVWWNGQEIVSPNHFGNQVVTIERTVTLQTENELKVRLAGSPDGRIVIVIDAASWTP